MLFKAVSSAHVSRCLAVIAYVKSAAVEAYGDICPVLKNEVDGDAQA